MGGAVAGGAVVGGAVMGGAVSILKSPRHFLPDQPDVHAISTRYCLDTHTIYTVDTTNCCIDTNDTDRSACITYIDDNAFHSTLL